MAFGARTIEIDGHDLSVIDHAFAEAASHVAGDKPTVIIAKTIKGKGFSEVENSPDWHGKPFPPDMADRAIAELGGVRNLVIRGARPEPAKPGPALEHPSTLPQQPGPPPPSKEWPTYKAGEKVATRKAYGDALVALGARDQKVVALDGEVSNSTYA